MAQLLPKRSIIKKTLQFGFFTFISRMLGALREVLQVRLLGVGAISDAFIMAFRIPNSLRKVFAEGALSAAFVPVFIKISKEENKGQGARLMSSAFLFFEGIVLFLCFLVWIFPEPVIRLVASGFSADQMAFATSYVRILFPFIFFISTSSLLAGALQAENHFFMPAFAPVLLNVFYILSLLFCLYYNASITYLCCGIIFGGIVQLICYMAIYLKLGYSFVLPNEESWKEFKKILKKFANCLFGVSLMELNFVIDGNIATHVGKGTASILYYGSRFMQIPLSIFAVAFSTVMLSYFSRVLLYAPKRLNFLLLEATKFICWVIIPAMLFLMFISEKLFSLLIMSKGVSAEHIWQAQWVLIILVAGLLFFSLNEILTNVFYAFNDTWTPTLVGIIATLCNLCGNLLSLKLPAPYPIFGIAASTTLSGVIFTVAAFLYLRHSYTFNFHSAPFLSFCARYLLQLSVLSGLFWFLHTIFFWGISNTTWYLFFFSSWGYWLFVMPLAALIALLFWVSRRWFSIKLYFL